SFSSSTYSTSQSSGSSSPSFHIRALTSSSEVRSRNLCQSVPTSLSSLSNSFVELSSLSITFISLSFKSSSKPYLLNVIAIPDKNSSASVQNLNCWSFPTSSGRNFNRTSLSLTSSIFAVNLP